MRDISYDEFTTMYTKVSDQNYQLLLLWKKMEGKNAICLHLLETLVAHGKTEEIRGLIQISLEGEFCAFF